ncbi:MAG: hypothetical protein ABI388_01535 [Bacteroidia bacterium]
MSLVQKLTTTDKGINLTNIALMLLSTGIAFIIPFKLFLFVYAVLGPLHYLTEISWLEKRNYFIKQKTQIWPYIVIALLMTVALFNEKSSLRYYTVSLILCVVTYTLCLVFSGKNSLSLIVSTIVLALAILIKADRIMFLILAFGIFLPTIVHVFLFTGLFVLQGALKNKSVTGFISLGVFIACALSFAFVHTPNSEILSLTEKGFVQKYFSIINQSLATLFNISFVRNSNEIFETPAFIAIQRFIAFAYTYHYLNWFSKTSVIKWHDVSKTRMWLILILWVISVACYYIDYRLGFMVLFLLSMLHVFLELPLNVHSIKGISSGVRNMFQ